MSEHELIGSSAFQWVDANAESSLDYPDEAFDWVFMLTDRDWELLDKVWSSRSSLWREAVSYFVIDGPICASRPMLLRALHDSNEDVLVFAENKNALLSIFSIMEMNMARSLLQLPLIF